MSVCVTPEDVTIADLSLKYHDDGEKELGPTVATLSLGGNATMCMRMKPLYWKGLSKTGAYYPDDRILPGALFVDERKALNKLHGKVSEAEFDQRRKAMYVQAAKRWAKKGKKNDSEDDPEEAPEDIDENVGKEDNEDGGKKQRRGFPKTPPDLVKMKLRHGDIVIMHGAEMQKYFEVSYQQICSCSFVTSASRGSPRQHTYH